MLTRSSLHERPLLDSIPLSFRSPSRLPPSIVGHLALPHSRRQLLWLRHPGRALWVGVGRIFASMARLPGATADVDVAVDECIGRGAPDGTEYENGTRTGEQVNEALSSGVNAQRKNSWVSSLVANSAH